MRRCIMWLNGAVPILSIMPMCHRGQEKCVCWLSRSVDVVWIRRHIHCAFNPCIKRNESMRISTTNMHEATPEMIAHFERRTRPYSSRWSVSFAAGVEPSLFGVRAATPRVLQNPRRFKVHSARAGAVHLAHGVSSLPSQRNCIRIPGRNEGPRERSHSTPCGDKSSSSPIPRQPQRHDRCRHHGNGLRLDGHDTRTGPGKQKCSELSYNKIGKTLHFNERCRRPYLPSDRCFRWCLAAERLGAIQRTADRDPCRGLSVIRQTTFPHVVR